jgi:ABC-type nitrate/sulfonate/bicarbonate transport system ATPase subunit
LTVRQNLQRAAAIRGASAPDTEKVLASFAAQELADRFPTSLSGGERCRASLSQALVGDPKVLLLDEPFTGLDVAAKRFVADHIFRVARSTGAGVIMVTHDLYDAVKYAGRVIVLGTGAPTRIVGEFPASMDAIDDMARLLMT